VRRGVERRVAIHLALRGVEQGFLVTGAAGDNVIGAHGPDTDTFVAPGVNVTGVLDGAGAVNGMQAAHMLVRQTVLAADKNFPQRPLPLCVVLTHFMPPFCCSVVPVLPRTRSGPS